MSRKFWENNLTEKYHKKLNIDEIINQLKEVSEKKISEFNLSLDEISKEGLYYRLINNLKDKELMDFYVKQNVPLIEINKIYSIRDLSDNLFPNEKYFALFNDYGMLRQIKANIEESRIVFCSYDSNNILINEFITPKLPSSNYYDTICSLKKYIEEIVLNPINHEKYISSLCSKYDELTNKGIECDIYLSSPAGHYFISKEQFLKDSNKDNALCYMLANGKGQCIFNKEIFELENKKEKKVIHSKGILISIFIMTGMIYLVMSYMLKLQ